MSYKYDITKYAGKRALNVEAIFDQLPLQLDTGTRRFVLNSIDDDARYESYRIQYSLRQLAIRKCQSKSSPWMLRQFHRLVYHHYLKIPSQCQQLFHLRKRQYSGGGVFISPVIPAALVHPSATTPASVELATFLLSVGITNSPPWM